MVAIPLSHKADFFLFKAVCRNAGGGAEHGGLLRLGPHYRSMESGGLFVGAVSERVGVRRGGPGHGDPGSEAKTLSFHIIFLMLQIGMS